MRVDIFDFELPEDCIAVRPAVPRDSSKLLRVTQSGMTDHVFTALPDMLGAGDVLVFNNTRVFPAHLHGIRGQAKIQATLHKEARAGCWWAFVKNAKRLKPGQTACFYRPELIQTALENGDAGTPLMATVVDKTPEQGVLFDFGCSAPELFEKLGNYGVMPLPPYIQSKRTPDEKDNSDYQTVFAKNTGAVAAPTAGLHFTPAVLDSLKNKGVKAVEVTLHVGAGTFMPVKVDDTGDHVMHAEYGVIDQQACDIINAAKKAGKRVVAVGTTALRVLESAATDIGTIEPFANDTRIFITPGYRFKIIDAIVTNFHLPRSTLFMLVCAIAGTARMKAAYTHAIQNGYRFYSYGDSSLLDVVRD